MYIQSYAAGLFMFTETFVEIEASIEVHNDSRTSANL